jgi:hypothetical protein
MATTELKAYLASERKILETEYNRLSHEQNALPDTPKTERLWQVLNDKINVLKGKKIAVSWMQSLLCD